MHTEVSSNLCNVDDTRCFTNLDISAEFRQDRRNIARNCGLMKKVLVLHGPNLNLLGLREPSLYGKTTLADLSDMLVEKAEAAGLELTTYQSNSEAELIHAIHQAWTNQTDYLIFNPAAFTHTSIALRDALLAVSIPFIEVHVSNIYAREPFRHQSFFSDIAFGVISGFGIQGYTLALQTIIEKLA